MSKLNFSKVTTMTDSHLPSLPQWEDDPLRTPETVGARKNGDLLCRELWNWRSPPLRWNAPKPVCWEPSAELAASLEQLVSARIQQLGEQYNSAETVKTLFFNGKHVRVSPEDVRLRSSYVEVTPKQTCYYHYYYFSVKGALGDHTPWPLSVEVWVLMSGEDGQEYLLLTHRINPGLDCGLVHNVAGFCDFPTDPSTFDPIIQASDELEEELGIPSNVLENLVPIALLSDDFLHRTVITYVASIDSLYLEQVFAVERLQEESTATTGQPAIVSCRPRGLSKRFKAHEVGVYAVPSDVASLSWIMKNVPLVRTCYRSLPLLVEWMSTKAST